MLLALFHEFYLMRDEQTVHATPPLICLLYKPNTTLMQYYACTNSPWDHMKTGKERLLGQ